MLKTGSGLMTSSMTSVLCLPPCCIYVPFENNQLDQIMDLEKACIIHRNSPFGRGSF